MKIQSIAVLITCFNRKKDTLNCIKCLLDQVDMDQVSLKIFIIDGGSSDGTVDAVKKKYPQVKIETRDGLYWAGGMRAAWDMAVTEEEFDFYFLVNDDTVIFPDTIFELLKADSYSRETLSKSGIYVASTYESETKNHSYGGKKLATWGKLSTTKIIPNGKDYVQCELGNANIMLVSKEVYDVLGNICSRYTHAIGDYDYTLRAVEKGYPVWVLPKYQGECTNDNGANVLPSSSTLKERISYLYSPKGNSYHEYMYFIKKFFPKYRFISFLKLWGRVFVPFLWSKSRK